MPRTLPWEKKGASAAAIQPKRPATALGTTQKKHGLQSVTPDVERQGGGSSRKERLTTSELPLSSSPPPEAPEESFMIEGLDHDDRFRMVEDEFLTTAQAFTAHLHAAEYKRQQKMVKSRNAETINSISRPVAGKMPDHTKRRVEGVARSKKQLKAIGALLGNKKEDGGMSDDSDDGIGLPYVGTTLHGLMDSPRKKAASISKIVPITATTRAAAGFNKPANNTKASRNSGLRSPQPKSVTLRASVEDNDGSETSEGEDDDLDAPIPAPKLISLERKSPLAAKAPLKFELPATTLTPRPLTKPKPDSTVIEWPNKGTSSHGFDEIPDFLAQAGSRPSRVRARQLKAKQEQSEKKLDEIPNFF